MKPVGNAFLVNHPYMGWAASGLLFIILMALVALYYKREADAAKEALVTVRQSNSDEKTYLLHRNNVPYIPDDLHVIRSEGFSDGENSEETWYDEFEPTYLQPSQRNVALLRNSRHQTHRQPSLMTRPHGVINSSVQATPIQRERAALRSLDMNQARYLQRKLIMDTSSVSTCSENTMPMSRPISYREMKKSSGFSPVYLPVSQAV